MRNGLPFSKPKVRLFGDPGEAQQYLGEAYNLLFKVRQFCEQSGVPVFSMQRQLPNGALVTAAIVGAEEIVSAFPPANGGSVEVRRGLKKIPYFLANFYGTPSSEDHPAGYVPQHPQHPDVQYPGPVSVWAGYNLDSFPPAPAPKTPEDKNELTPVLPIEDQPGNCTWWSDQIKFRKEAVVLSWKHPLNMQGRYGVITRFKNLIGYGSPALYRGNYDLQRFPGSPYVSGGDFSAVWVNGVKIKLLGVSRVFSAALKNEIDPESGEEQVFLCVLTLDGETLNFRKAPFPWSFKDLMDEPSAQRQVSLANVFKKLNDRVLKLQQPPFINASATACLVLCESKMPDGYFYSTGYPYTVSTGTLVLNEWVFDNDTSDRVANSEYVYTLEPTLSRDKGVLSQNLLDAPWVEATWSFERTSSISRGDIVSKRVDILCADYCGDELVYVSSVIEGVSQGLSSERRVQYRHTFANKQLSFVETGPSTADVTTAWLYVHEANTSTSLIFGSSSVSAKLVHSKKGALVSDALSYGDSDKFDYAYSGGVNADWVTFNSAIVSQSIQNSGGFEFFLPQVAMDDPDEFPEGEYARTLYGYSLAFSVLGGDLRTDILLCEKIRDKTETNHSRTVTNPEGWYTKLKFATDNNGLQTKEVTSSVLLLDKGRVVELAVSTIREQSEVLNGYSQSDDNLAATETLRLDPTNFESSSASGGSSLKIGITCTPINLHYENPREENDPLFKNNELEYLPYSSFSSDTRGDYAYFGFCQPDTWVDPKEVNAFKIKNTLHILEPETYAPGNFSTLSEPVFFGKVFDREDNIPDD